MSIDDKTKTYADTTYTLHFQKFRVCIEIHTIFSIFWENCRVIKKVSTIYKLAGLWLFVSIWFQVYFTPLTGVLFTFPSRYLFTIGRKKYLALPSGFGKFPQNFTYSVVLKELINRNISFVYAAIMLYGLSFQIYSTRNIFCNCLTTLPWSQMSLITPTSHER